MLGRRYLAIAAFVLAAGSTAVAPSVASAATAPGTQAAHTGPMLHPVGPMLGQHGISPDASTSTNWSGYAATGGKGAFSSVSASWTEPTGHCTSGDQYSSFWVGLDGYTSSTVEQTGSEVDCNGRTPEYYAWYEMYPGPSEDFSNTVRPGDHFSASVTHTSGSSYKLVISDSTQGWSHTENESLSSAQDSSAEVIIEAPCCTNSGGILPLANFGTINLANSDVNGQAIGNYNPTEIIMQSGSTQKDSVTSLSGGTAFSATWLHS